MILLIDKLNLTSINIMLILILVVNLTLIWLASSSCTTIGPLPTALIFIICDPSARNQSHVGRVRFPLRAEMHGRGHITDSCFIAFITSKIC